MEEQRRLEDTIYRALARAIWLAVALFLAFWFLDTITVIILLLLVAIILTMALNPPVTWLEAHRLPRVVGTLLVLAGVAAVVGLLGWLIVPRLIEQGTALVTSLPSYLSALTTGVADWLRP